MARLLDGERGAPDVEAGDAAWLDGLGLPVAAGDAELELLVTPPRVQPRTPTGSSIIRRSWRSASAASGAPRRGAGGPGRRDARRARPGAAPAVACVVSLDLKAAEPAVHALAAGSACRPASSRPSGCSQETTASPALRRSCSARPAAGASPKAPRWPRPARTAGCVVPKRKGARRHLRHRPGAERDSTPQASAARAAARHRRPRARRRRAGAPRRRSACSTEAEELVGYGLYLDLVGPAAAGKPRHDFPLGAEEERCRFALGAPPRAARGAGLLRRSRHLRPGDAGFELLERAGRAGLGAASRSTVQPRRLRPAGRGRPRRRPARPRFLRHLALRPADPGRGDRAAARAAAAGDFVIALYNPVSQRRRELLGRARDILLGTARRHAGRPRPQSRPPRRDHPRSSTLAELDRRHVDMLTLVLVGSSAHPPRAAPARAGLGLHPARLPTSHDRPLHRRRPGRARPDHRARPAPDPALPGLPLCRLAGAGRGRGRGARRRPRASTPRR